MGIHTIILYVIEHDKCRRGGWSSGHNDIQLYYIHACTCAYTHIFPLTITQEHIAHLKGQCVGIVLMKSYSIVTACFIIKCDTKCYDYAHQNGRPLALIAVLVYNNVWALVVFHGIQRQYWLVRRVLYAVEQ